MGLLKRIFGREHPTLQPTNAPSSPMGPGEFEVQDVFSITGRGTVATGRVLSGDLRLRSTVRITRGGVEVAVAQITGLEQFRKRTDSAAAGDQVGVLLKDIQRTDVQRGDRLTVISGA